MDIEGLLGEWKNNSLFGERQFKNLDRTLVEGQY